MDGWVRGAGEPKRPHCGTSFFIPQSLLNVLIGNLYSTEVTNSLRDQTGIRMSFPPRVSSEAREIIPAHKATNVKKKRQAWHLQCIPAKRKKLGSPEQRAVF